MEEKELSFRLEMFEGPLDLLLHLIKKNKVSIYDIPIVEITGQYLEYLEKMEEMNLEISSEFTVMAAQLLYIKSKMLLPKHEDEEEEDPKKDLVDRLVEYQKVKEAREKLKPMQNMGYFSYYKEPQKIVGIETQRRLDTESIEKLTNAFMLLIEKTERKAPPPVNKFDGIIGREIVTVKQKTDHILRNFKKGKKVSFKESFDGITDKSEAVSMFLAILELLRSGVLIVKEEGEELYIERTELEMDIIDVDENEYN